jgi:hypothetical protein
MLLEGGRNTCAPGPLGVGGMAEEGVRWSGEEVGVVVAKGCVVRGC